MVEWETGKLEYSEAEAATLLGLSIEQLRTLVRMHVTKDDAGSEAALPGFRQTDLLLLKMLSKGVARVW